jgi:hypothetical protein
MLTGSLGMLPSASLGAPDDVTGKRKALYEPVHGSAPDIAGQNIANPIAMIASFAMCMRYSFNMISEAALLEQAIAKVLDDGLRTKDIMSEGMTEVGTSGMGTAILMSPERLKKGLWIFLDKQGFRLATGIRIVAGILFLLAGVAIPFIGSARIERLASWWLERPDWALRVWAVAAGALGGADPLVDSAVHLVLAFGPHGLFPGVPDAPNHEVLGRRAYACGNDSRHPPRPGKLVG